MRIQAELLLRDKLTNILRAKDDAGAVEKENVFMNSPGPSQTLIKIPTLHHVT